MKNILVTILSTIIISLILGLFLTTLNITSTIFFNNSWMIIFLPLVGVVVRYFYNKYGKESDKGNKLLVESYKNNKNIPFRLAILAPISALLSHLFGASVGREGIGLQVGASVFSSIATKLKLTDENKKIMILAGISSGFAIIFQTPFSGMIFGYEFLKWQDKKTNALFYSFISSFIGIEIIKLFNIHHHNYYTYSNIDYSLKFILIIIIIGLVSGFAAYIFVSLLNIIKSIYINKINNDYLRVFLSGIVIVLFLILVQSTKYQGLGLNLIDDAFNGDTSWYDGILKIISTTLSVGGGFFGGEVTPLFSIGASLGSATATLFIIPVAIGASLGYIGVFSSAAQTPLTGVMLGIELFGINGLLLYILVCFVGFMINRKKGIYS